MYLEPELASQLALTGMSRLFSPVVNTNTGAHSTVDSGFADDLARNNPNYQKVPANPVGFQHPAQMLPMRAGIEEIGDYRLV